VIIDCVKSWPLYKKWPRFIFTMLLFSICIWKPCSIFFCLGKLLILLFLDMDVLYIFHVKNCIKGEETGHLCDICIFRVTHGRIFDFWGYLDELQNIIKITLPIGFSAEFSYKLIYIFNQIYHFKPTKDNHFRAEWFWILNTQCNII